MLFNRKKYKDIYEITRTEITRFYKGSVDNLVSFVNQNSEESFIENKVKMNLKILELINKVNDLYFDSNKYLREFKSNIDAYLKKIGSHSPESMKLQLERLKRYNIKTLANFQKILEELQSQYRVYLKNFGLIHRKEKENLDNEFEKIMRIYKDDVYSVTKGLDRKFMKSIIESRKKINLDLLNKIDILDLSYKRDHIKLIHLFARRREKMIQEVVYIKEINLSFWKKIGTFIDLLKSNLSHIDYEVIISFEVKINRIISMWKEQISNTIKHLRHLVFRDNGYIKDAMDKIIKERDDNVKKIISKRPELVKANLIRSLAEFNKEIQKHNLKDKLEDMNKNSSEKTNSKASQGKLKINKGISSTSRRK